jgi:hypothetical protein
MTSSTQIIIGTGAKKASPMEIYVIIRNFEKGIDDYNRTRTYIKVIGAYSNISHAYRVSMIKEYEENCNKLKREFDNMRDEGYEDDKRGAKSLD